MAEQDGSQKDPAWKDQVSLTPAMQKWYDERPTAERAAIDNALNGLAASAPRYQQRHPGDQLLNNAAIPGHDRKQLHGKKLKGLEEVRFRMNRSGWRATFYEYKGQGNENGKYRMLTQFKKQGNKTPTNELDKARGAMVRDQEALALEAKLNKGGQGRGEQAPSRDGSGQRSPGRTDHLGKRRSERGRESGKRPKSKKQSRGQHR